MKILLAEDEEQLASVETAFLKLKGFEVDNAYNGEEAVEKAASAAYDVMILDVMMPIKDGLQALREIRASGNTTPVIMLTAKAEVDDRVDGLTAGADDYLTKPFAMKELEARIRAQIRRTEQFRAESINYGDITLNIDEQELCCKNSVRLAGKEAKLLEYFMRNPERELVPEAIYSHVWKENNTFSPETLELYVSYLKGKLMAVSSEMVIECGKTYKFCKKGNPA